MLTLVAGDRPYDVFTLWDEPLWRVLYVFHHLTDKDARQALRDRVARVDLGLLVSHAFNAPAALNDELRDAQHALESFDEPADQAVTDLAALRAAGEALAARLEAGRVLAPEALTTVPA